LRSNQLALLDAEITLERLALEEAIREVEAEAARKSPTETRTEPAPSEGMPDDDNIQSRDHGQPASPDRDDRSPALPSRQAPIFLPTASDDRHNTDIQAVAIGEAYGADHYHDDIPGLRWRGSLLVVIAVLALAVLAGIFANRAMFGGSVFPALPPIINAGTGLNNIVRNNSDTRQSNSSQTSVTSAGSSEKLQPMDIREAPKTVPRVISTIPISSKPSAALVAPLAPAPAATAPALDPPVVSALDPPIAASAASVPPPASAPLPVPASSEPKETAAVVPVAHEPDAPSPAVAPPVLPAASVPPPASAPVPVPASSKPKEIHRFIVGLDGWGEAGTSSPPALADAQGDAAPSASSRSPMKARSGTAMEVSSGGVYAVQVASQRSAAEARASFRALRAKFPNQLGGREPMVRRTNLGAKGIYYRAMVGPFASMEKAAGMCRTLKAAGCNCLIQRN
jgi:hypothetical protein